MTKALQDKIEKFYFNVNIFDEKEEPTEPPPPMFSEGELAAAREKGFAEGKAEGLRQGDESRAQFISKILEKISKDGTILFTAEAAREKTYEQDAVKLCLAVFQKAFPLYQEKFGLDELKKHVEIILKRQAGQKQITIHVAPDVVDGIRDHLSKLKTPETGINYAVQGDDTLPPGSCRLSWADGGAVRNAADLATEIETALKDLLAASAAKGHDGKTMETSI